LTPFPAPGHVEPSMPISSTRLSCPLHDKVYGTSPVGSAFDRGDRPRPTPHSLQPLPSSACRISRDLRSCRLPGAFIMRPCLPYRHKELRCSRAPWLPGHYSSSPLLRAHPPPSRRQPLSRLAGYMTYPAPPISQWDEDGFSSCLTCPNHRAVPNTPPECLIASVSLRRFMLPSPNR
jgi:hypothetical protein